MNTILNYHWMIQILKESIFYQPMLYIPAGTDFLFLRFKEANTEKQRP